MASSPSLDPLDFETAPDEELPDYEPATAPEYDRELFEVPLHTYHLRQIDRKLQMLVPYGPSASLSYKISARGVRLFSKKPEIEVWRTCPGIRTEESVAGIWFDVNGPLPWRPRAHFIFTGTEGVCTGMESRNFSDWTMTIAGVPYVWILEARPFSMVFHERSRTDVIARFTFSDRGTMASGGAEAGTLAVYQHPFSMERGGVENLVCGLVVALAHFRKMGRHYWNASYSATRATSLTREHDPLHRSSITTYSTL